VTHEEQQLVAALLDMAAAIFSNHGCNDFDLAKYMPKQEDRDNLIKNIAKWNGTPAERPYPMDWLLMSYFADQLRKYTL
jgi:hypothetical protein